MCQTARATAPEISRPSHIMCAVSQRACVGAPRPSQSICAGNGPESRVRHISFARRYTYRSGLAIAERLAASDPGNAGWQRDLSVSQEKIGYLAAKRGDRLAAGEAYGRARDILTRLTALDPSNATWRKDLAWVERQLNAISGQAKGG